MKTTKVTIHTLRQMKERGEKIAMLTAYDATFARLLDEAGADAWSALARRRRDRLVLDEAGASHAVPHEAATASAAWREVLTERELEVTLLVIEGASNREIAAQLYVSVRTVEVHVGRILAKLDVRSRVELTVLAHRVGLSA